MDPSPPRDPIVPRRRRAPVALPALALSIALAARAASAQTPQDLLTRRHLIEQATAARAAGHHAEALAFAQRAAAVQVTPSVRLFIAQEMAETGDPAGALGMADQCVRDVERDTTVANRATLLSACRSLVTETRALVGYLVLRVPDPPPEGLRVLVRGTPVNTALLGAPYVVSPGDVAVEASAHGRQTFRRTAVVARGATVDLPVTLDPAPVVPVPQVPTTAPVEPAPAPMPTPSRAGPILLMSAGSAALLGGALLLVARGSALDGCTVSGDTAACVDQASADSAASANGLTAGSAVLFGVGAVAVGAGLVWLLRTPSAPRRVDVSLGLAPFRDGVSVGLAGRIP